jgi:anti-sigma factor RsiW
MTEHVTRLLDRYYDGELSARERARVERHLAACAGCRAALEELEQLSAVLRESLPVPTCTPPDRFVAQVRLRLAPRQSLAERRWVKVGGVAFPVALAGAWIFVQVTWSLIAVALVAVELGWGAGLGLQPAGGLALLGLLSGGWRGGLDLVRGLAQLGGTVRWLALVPLQMMVAIAALYGLWLVALRRWEASRA